MQRHVFSCQVKFPNQKIEDLVADIGRDLETDCLVEPPSTELHFNGFEQVVGFFVFNRQVTIAAHAERCPVLNDHADEEPVELGTDHQFGGQEPTGRTLDESREHVRNFEPSKSAITRLGIGHVDGERQAQGQRYTGNGWPGIDGERRENRKHPLFVEVIKLGALGGVVSSQPMISTPAARSSGTR